MSRTWAPRRVYGGRLIEASDTRLVFVRSPSPAPVVWVLLVASAIVALWVLVLTATIPPEAAALASALPSFLLLTFGLLPLAITQTRMHYVRRQLLVERVAGDDSAKGPRFGATVDGRRVVPASPRLLYELRHRELAAPIVRLGEHVIMLPYYRHSRQTGVPEGGLDRSRATLALLRADREFDETYGNESMAPLVQALVRVLDLRPDRTGGDVAAYELRMAGRDAGAAYGGLSAHAALRSQGVLLILFIAWQTAGWLLLVPRLLPLGEAGGTVVFAIAQLAVPFLVLHQVLQLLYVRPLNAKADALVAKEEPETR